MSTESLNSALHFDAKFNLFRPNLLYLKTLANLRKFWSTIVSNNLVTLGMGWIKLGRNTFVYLGM